MVQVSHPHGLVYVGMHIADTESPIDGADPSLEVDQLGENSAREEMYFGQIQDDVRSRPDHHRVQKFVQRF